MNTRSAKAKGRSLQNRVAKDLASITGLRYGSPNDDLADLRGRLMGTPGADIVRSERAMKILPFYVECKNTESWSFGPEIFNNGLGQLIRWYFKTLECVQKLKDREWNIPIVVAAKARVSPIVIIDGLEISGLDRIISVTVPVRKFLDTKSKYLVPPEFVVNILSWTDFLDFLPVQEEGERE